MAFGMALLGCGSNHRVLRPFATAHQHAHRFGAVELAHQALEHLHRGGFGVGQGQNHIALLNASACCSLGRSVHAHAAPQFELFLLRIGQIAQRQT